MRSSLDSRLASLVLLAAVSVPLSGVWAQEPVSLFNGFDLTGWTKLGGDGTFQVENGVIVGRSAPNTENTFLVTNAAYDNFLLELDFWIDDTAFNSGVQIRSQLSPSHNDGRAYGYQVEIDPSPRRWSGGLYFEGGSPSRSAGWLDDLSDNPIAQDAFVLGQWNTFRIEARGNRLQAWINSVPAADFFDTDVDALLTGGFIGLQVHSVGPAVEPKEVRFRDLLLTPFHPGSAIDFSGDGVTDSNDYALLMQSMFVSHLGALPGDLNGDQIVDFADHRLFAKFYDRTNGDGAFSAMATDVPEPGAAVCLTAVLSLAGAAYLRRLGDQSSTRWKQTQDPLKLPRTDTLKLPTSSPPPLRTLPPSS